MTQQALWEVLKERICVFLEAHKTVVFCMWLKMVVQASRKHDIIGQFSVELF